MCFCILFADLIKAAHFNSASRHEYDDDYGGNNDEKTEKRKNLLSVDDDEAEPDKSSSYEFWSSYDSNANNKVDTDGGGSEVIRLGGSSTGRQVRRGRKRR